MLFSELLQKTFFCCNIHELFLAFTSQITPVPWQTLEDKAFKSVFSLAFLDIII